MNERSTHNGGGIRQPIADKLHTAAGAVRDQAEAVIGVAEAAADKLEASATYLDYHDSKDIAKDLWALVRRHPRKSLLVAAVIGFLVARAFRKEPAA